MLHNLSEIAIVTTDARGVVETIHERMPLTEDLQLASHRDGLGRPKTVGRISIGSRH
jgi:hypothetical protein